MRFNTTFAKKLKYRIIWIFNELGFWQSKIQRHPKLVEGLKSEILN